MSSDLASAVTDQACLRLDECMAKIRHCVNQLRDEQLWWRGSEELNSIANLLIHLRGNLRQWLIHGIQQSPDQRDRPSEFADRSGTSGKALLEQLGGTVDEVKAVLKDLGESDLLASRRIQGFETTALGAIFDSVPHFNGHAQEIIYMTRSLLGKNYQFAWTPSTPEEGAALT